MLYLVQFIYTTCQKKNLYKHVLGVERSIQEKKKVIEQGNCLEFSCHSCQNGIV